MLVANAVIERVPTKRPSGCCGRWAVGLVETKRYVIVDREITDAAGLGFFKVIL